MVDGLMLVSAPLVVLTLLAPAPSADLEAKVRAIFADKCTSCHDEGGEEPSLVGPLGRLTRQKGASGAPMVVAGDPKGSYLIAKMAGEKGIVGDPMPLGDDPLPKQEMEAVRAWIAALPKEGGAASPAAAAPVAAAPAGPSLVELEAQVKALFAAKCLDCHDVGSEDGVLAGPLAPLSNQTGAGGPLIVAGDPEGSYLFRKLVGGAGMKGELMPMGDDPLGEADLAKVRNYIVALKTSAAGGDQAAVNDGAGAGGVSLDAGEGDGGSGGGGGGEEGGERRRAKATFHGTFQINLPTTTGLGKRKFEFRVDHRFGKVGAERGAFGLDAGGGIVMSLGFAYGIIDGLDVLLRRTNSRKGYELGVKYVPLRQEAGAPVSVGGYTSLELYRDFKTNTSNPLSGNFQAMVSRLWFERWSTMLVLGYHLRTNHAANVSFDFEDGKGPVPVKDTRGTLSVGVASTMWLGKKRRWGLDMEYALPIASDKFYYNGGDVNPGGAKIGSWSLGGSWTSGMHLFQIFVSNTREIHTNLYAPGGLTQNPFSGRGNFFLGFNLSRKWSL